LNPHLQLAHGAEPPAGRHRREIHADAPSQAPPFQRGDLAVITFADEHSYVRRGLAEFTDLGTWWRVGHGGIVEDGAILAIVGVVDAVLDAAKPVAVLDQLDQLRGILDRFLDGLLAPTPGARRG